MTACAAVPRGRWALLREELGPLAALLDAPDVSDVLVNGPDEVWVDRGEGLVRTGLTFPSGDELRRLVHALAARAGRRLDAGQPFADLRLTGGVRAHAVLAPSVADRTYLSIRLPPLRTCTLDELGAAGAFPADGARLLARLVRSRASFLVTGGTGAGKTTLLSALLGLGAPQERLVLVEDVPELQPGHPHVARLHTRAANAEGAGAVRLDALVREALRMRPDRLVVGEVRGPEVVDLLAALNTGHDGGCGTLHANSAADVPARVEALAAAAGLSRAAVHAQLAAGLGAVVHVHRVAGRRRVRELAALRRGDGGAVEVVTAWQFADDGLHEGPAAAELGRLLEPG